MGITDIPGQIVTALKYSVRSPGAFVLSLISAVVVLGVAFDLLYGFFYTRLYQVKDPHYGDGFWLGLCIFGAMVPLAWAGITLAAAWLKLRRFPPDKFGIAIAPFDVFSIDPDTLGTATKLASLDEAMRQFFNAAQRASAGEHWLDDFEFRFLPPYVRVRSRQDALSRREAMNAELIIWGEILQQSNAPLKMTQNLLGTKVDLRLDGPMELSLAGTLLALYAMCSAGFRLGDAGKRAEAVNMFTHAKDGPARKVDEYVKDPKQPHHHVDLMDQFINEYQPNPQLVAQALC